MCVRSVREIASSESACVFIGAADRRREEKVINIYKTEGKQSAKKRVALAWIYLGGYIWARL